MYISLYFNFNIYFTICITNIYTKSLHQEEAFNTSTTGFLSQQYDADVEAETLMASGGASMGIDLAMRSFATDGQVPITVDGFRVGIGGWVGVLHGFYRKKKR